MTHDAEGPYIIDEEAFERQGGTVAVCQCELSGNEPYCDGSHGSCADEDDGVLYNLYPYEGDDKGERRVVSCERHPHTNGKRHRFHWKSARLRADGWVRRAPGPTGPGGQPRAHDASGAVRRPPPRRCDSKS